MLRSTDASAEIASQLMLFVIDGNDLHLIKDKVIELLDIAVYQGGVEILYVAHLLWRHLQ